MLTYSGRNARRWLPLVVTILAAAASLTGQTQTQTPTFRSGVELVAIDFIAVTSDGHPVADLRASDLTLKVNGRAREIRELQFIRLGPDEGDERPAAAKAAPLAFGTNSAGEIGRNVIFLFDDNTIRLGNERPARDAAAHFLDAMSPRDRVALATRGRVEVDLTTNHQLVREGLAHITGHAAGGASTRPTGGAIPQAGSSTGWLRTFLLGLKDIDGPKTVIMIAESRSTPGGRELTSSLFDLKDVAEAAFVARTQLYIIQPNNFGIDAGQNAADLGKGRDDAGFAPTSWTTGDDISGLADLASVTGGEVFRLSGKADEVFKHIIRQSSAYYLLGFAPDADERNGKTQRIDIKVARPGVTIRARQEFAIPRAAPSAVAGPTLPQMVGDLKTYRDVPLRAAAFTARSAPKGELNVVIVAETVDPSMALGQVAFGLIDTVAHKMPLARPASASEITDVRAVAGAVIKPGTYHLRVVAITKDGRRGAVEYEFVAGLGATAPLEVGDLMVGQGRPDGTFEPQLIAGSRPAATAYVELQGTLPRGTSLSAAFEVAATADGPAIATIAGIIVPVEGAPNRWNARGVIPVGNLTAGEYVVRATIKVNDAVIARPMRSLRKVQ